MEINLNRKKVLRNLGTSIKTAFIILIFFLNFSLLAQAWTYASIPVGATLLNILQILLPYAIYLSIFYIIVSIIIVAVGEFSNRNY